MAGVTLYALILLATALIVLSSIGVDVAGVGQIVLVTIFVIALLTFFLLPFLPKMPFQIGYLLEVGGTRAAALSYGVMQELRDTGVEIGRRTTRIMTTLCIQ